MYKCNILIFDILLFEEYYPDTTHVEEFFIEDRVSFEYSTLYSATNLNALDNEGVSATNDRALPIIRKEFPESWLWETFVDWLVNN